MTFCTSGDSGGSLNKLKEVRVTEPGCCQGPLPSLLRSLSPSVCIPRLPLRRPLVPWEHSLTASHFGAVWPGLLPRKPMWRGLLFPQGSLHTSFGAPTPKGFSGPHRPVPGYLLGASSTRPVPLLLGPLSLPRARPPLRHVAPPSWRGRTLDLGRVEPGAQNLLTESWWLTRSPARSSAALWAR